MAEWWIRRGEDVTGPVEGSLLVQALRDGTIKADDEACLLGGGTWVPVLAVPEVAAVMPTLGTAVASAPPVQQQPSLGFGTQGTPPAIAQPPGNTIPSEPVPVSHIIVLVIAGVVGVLLGINDESLSWPLVVMSAIFVYADAWANGIRKKNGEKGFLNLSPLAWSISAMLLAILALPLYFSARSRLRTRNGNALFFALSATSSIALLVVTAASMLGPIMGPQPLPTCNATEVTQTLKQVLEGAPSNRARDVRVIDLGTPGEIRFDRAAEQRTCRTDLTSTLGAEVLFYTVEWQDKAKNLYWVQVRGD